MNNKLKNINRVVTQNVNLSKEIESLTITNRNVVDTKKITTINLINDEHFNDDEITIYKFHFDVFPEWAVSMSRVEFMFTADNAYALENIWILDNYSNYRWTKNSDTAMTLEVLLYLSAIDGVSHESIPILATVDLIIYNDKKFS